MAKHYLPKICNCIIQRSLSSNICRISRVWVRLKEKNNIKWDKGFTDVIVKEKSYLPTQNKTQWYRQEFPVINNENRTEKSRGHSINGYKLTAKINRIYASCSKWIKGSMYLVPNESKGVQRPSSGLYHRLFLFREFSTVSYSESCAEQVTNFTQSMQSLHSL